MAFLSDKITDIGLPAELSLFTVPPNQVAVDKIYFNECRPVSSFNTEDAPIEITVPGQGSNEYIDLRRSRLYVKCKIVKSDGSPLAAQEKTGIINLPLQTMWSQIDTYMNGKLVSLNTSYYAWKAYLKLLLSSGDDASQSQLQSQLYYPDDDDMDNADAYGGNNSGLNLRYTFTQQSRIFDLEGPLYEDIFRIDKYLVNGVDLHLKLFRNPAAFVLMSKEASPGYKLQLLDVSFKACMVKVDSGILINHAEIMKDKSAKYPLNRTEVKMSTCPLRPDHSSGRTFGPTLCQPKPHSVSYPRRPSMGATRRTHSISRTW